MRHNENKASQALKSGDQQQYLKTIEHVLGVGMKLKGSGISPHQLPLFVDQRSGIEFALIPGGEFEMGLTELEERAARKIFDPPPLNVSELRPVRRRIVSPFLMSTKPMLVGMARRLFGDTVLSKYDSRNPTESYPAYVVREAALKLADELHCRLPYEAEWEYACRANSRSLFIWGNKLLPDNQLRKWLDLERPEAWKSNKFGLHALFSGDWCMDQWKASHEDSAPVSTGVFVVKGGGSIFWPWQGSGEWVWCIPANRMSSAGLIEGRCAFRLVRDLPKG